MKLLSAIWQTAAPWKTKRAFLTKLALDAAGAGDLPLALEAWRYIAHGDAHQAFYGHTFWAERTECV